MTWSLEACFRAVCGYAGRVVDEFRHGLDTGFDGDDGFDEEAADAYLRSGGQRPCDTGDCYHDAHGLPCPYHCYEGDAAERLAEREALEDVAEPRGGCTAFGDLIVLDGDGTSRTIPAGEWSFAPPDDTPLPEPQLTDDELVGVRGLLQERYGDQRPNLLTDLIDTTTAPAGSQENSPAKVDGDPPDMPHPAGYLDWEGFAIPAICEVLAEHTPCRSLSECPVRDIHCAGPDRKAHAKFADWQEWREHVAPLIAARLACDPETAATALHAMRAAEQRVDSALHKLQQ